MTAPEAFNRQSFEYHPMFGHRYIPGLKARIQHESGGYLVQVNQSGFRSHHEFEPAPARTVGKRRVLLFGDSFTAGDGVSNGRRYGDLLESLVPDLEVFNFAMPATGTDQQYLIFDQLARGIEHDLLVIAMQVENLRRNAARYKQFVNEKGEPAVYHKPYFELVDGAPVLRGVPVRRDAIPEAELPPEERAHIDTGGRFQGLRNAVIALGLKDVVQRITRYQPLPEYDDPDNPAWKITRAILEMWIRSQRRPVLLVPLPLYMYIEGTSDPAGYQARFRELASAAHCHLHDPLPDLLAYPATERRGFRFETDVHPTAAGHAALAKSIVPAIQRILALA